MGFRSVIFSFFVHSIFLKNIFSEKQARWEGIWKEGVQHGEGVFTDVEGKSKKGVWKSGKLLKWAQE